MYGVLLLLAPVVAAENEPSAPDVVLRWNEITLKAIRTGRTPPPIAARNLAIVHAAVYDSVMGVYRTHKPYRVEVVAPLGTSPVAAAAIAAHRVLVTLYPAQIEMFDAALDESLATVPDGEGKKNGIRAGQGVAERLLNWRRSDGADRRTSYKPATGLGLWQPTLPGYKAALLPGWSSVTCFCMKSGSQFRPPAPPTLTSDEFAVDYHEVKRLGDVNSTVRTKEQTEIARFWADDEGTVTPPGHWNEIARTVARQRGTTLAENARLFALLNLTLADAAIVAWDCKYHFHVWRPVQAIREVNPDWVPLLTTPPFPSYTSGHSTFSGAAAAVLAGFFGSDDMTFSSTSDSLPGVRRTFVRFSAAAQEAGKSRIYGGIHWEFDNREGLACGKELGEYVVRNFLRPRLDK